MQPSSLLIVSLAALIAAAPARAQPKERDPNKRPELYDIAPRVKRDAKTPLKTDEAHQLGSDLAHGYLNISGLDLFLHRTDIPRNISAEDRAWAEEALAKAVALGDELAAEGQAALDAGIERRVPYAGPGAGMRLRVGGLFLGRAKLGLRPSPTNEELRRAEYGALGGVLSDLSNLVRAAAEPKDDVEPAEVAKAEKALAEDRTDLADARRRQGALSPQETAMRAEQDQWNIGEAARRAERAKRMAQLDSMPDLKRGEPLPPQALQPPSGGLPDKEPDTFSPERPLSPPAGVTADQAAKAANALPRAQPLRRAKKITVPAP